MARERKRGEVAAEMTALGIVYAGALFMLGLSGMRAMVALFQIYETPIVWAVMVAMPVKYLQQRIQQGIEGLVRSGGGNERAGARKLAGRSLSRQRRAGSWAPGDAVPAGAEGLGLLDSHLALVSGWVSKLWGMGLDLHIALIAGWAFMLCLPRVLRSPAVQIIGLVLGMIFALYYAGFATIWAAIRIFGITSFDLSSMPHLHRLILYVPKAFSRKCPELLAREWMRKMVGRATLLLVGVASLCGVAFILMSLPAEARVFAEGAARLQGSFVADLLQRFLPEIPLAESCVTNFITIPRGANSSQLFHHNSSLLPSEQPRFLVDPRKGLEFRFSRPQKLTAFSMQLCGEPQCWGWFLEGKDDGAHAGGGGSWYSLSWGHGGGLVASGPTKFSVPAGSGGGLSGRALTSLRLRFDLMPSNASAVATECLASPPRRRCRKDDMACLTSFAVNGFGVTGPLNAYSLVSTWAANLTKRPSMVALQDLMNAFAVAGDGEYGEYGADTAENLDTALPCPSSHPGHFSAALADGGILSIQKKVKADKDYLAFLDACGSSGENMLSSSCVLTLPGILSVYRDAMAKIAEEAFGDILSWERTQHWLEKALKQGSSFSLFLWNWAIDAAADVVMGCVNAFLNFLVFFQVLVILTYSKSSGGGLVSWTLESYTTIEEPVIKLIEKAFEEHIAGVFISITKIIVLHFAYSWLSLYSFGLPFPVTVAILSAPMGLLSDNIVILLFAPYIASLFRSSDGWLALTPSGILLLLIQLFRCAFSPISKAVYDRHDRHVHTILVNWSVYSGVFLYGVGGFVIGPIVATLPGLARDLFKIYKDKHPRPRN